MLFYLSLFAHLFTQTVSPKCSSAARYSAAPAQNPARADLTLCVFQLVPGKQEIHRQTSDSFSAAATALLRPCCGQIAAPSPEPPSRWARERVEATALIFGHGLMWEHFLQQDFEVGIFMEDDVTEAQDGGWGEGGEGRKACLLALGRKGNVTRLRTPLIRMVLLIDSWGYPPSRK